MAKYRTSLSLSKGDITTIKQIREKNPSFNLSQQVGLWVKSMNLQPKTGDISTLFQQRLEQEKLTESEKKRLLNEFTSYKLKITQKHKAQELLRNKYGLTDPVEIEVLSDILASEKILAK